MARDVAEHVLQQPVVEGEDSTRCYWSARYYATATLSCIPFMLPEVLQV